MPTAPQVTRRAAALAMLVAAAIPLAVLVGSGGAHILDPRESDWLLRGDAAQHQVAWSFYAREPWHWPPAEIESWPAPLGTTIGLTDAIPLVAMPLKAVAGGRAADLQYFGLWSALCLAALGVAAALFLLEAGGGTLLAALGGGLVALSPVVWERVACGHLSLAAHALLVGIFVAWLRYFRSGGERRWIVAAGALVVGAAAVHPYLLMMTATLLVALVAFGGVRFGLRALDRSASVALGALSIAALVAWLSGFLSLPTRALAIGSFGGMEADLLALLDASDFSRLVRPLFAGERHPEGFAWLGAGTLALGAVGLTGRLRACLRRRPTGEPAVGAEVTSGMAELWFAAFALALLSVLPIVAIAGHRIVDLSQELSDLQPLFLWFRANGRWIWPLHLLATLGAVLSLRQLSVGRMLFAALLLAGLGLQVLERSPRGWEERGRRVSPSALAASLESASLADPEIRELALVPAYLQSGAAVHCGGDRVSDRWVEPALIAARRGWRFNSGYLARVDPAKAADACESSTIRAHRAKPVSSRLLVVPVRQARALMRGGAFRCSRVSRNQWICRGSPRGDRRIGRGAVRSVDSVRTVRQ